jgi:hypothetical protein
MKVKEIIKKLRLCSNASVIVEGVKYGSVVELKESDLRNMEPEYIMEMKVNSMDIVDNILTIYAE